MGRSEIIIIGGGSAGLMAANILCEHHNVSIYDKEKNLGQKFLVAGKGGFNLTNSAIGAELKSKYLPSVFMDKALTSFDTMATRQWLANLDVPTFIGSSGRVFPDKGIRPIDVLNKIKQKLLKSDVKIFTQHEFIGFDDNRHVTIRNQGIDIFAKADFVIFALGGASWPQTGSNGLWKNIFESMGIVTAPFQSSNCGINICWPEVVKQCHAGKPLKNVKLFTDDSEMLGEAVITDYGMEGNAVYPLIHSIRKNIFLDKSTNIYIDFKPNNTEEELLLKSKGQVIKTKDYGQLFNLSASHIAIIKAYTSKDVYLSNTAFIKSIKSITIPVHSLRPVDEAISTVGGIVPDELNNDFSLKKYPWIYTIGEMVDWDAPTGGFLLQGCFSMGYYAAMSILNLAKIKKETA